MKATENLTSLDRLLVFFETYEGLWSLFLVFITTVLWGVYVYYTRQTFKEIKKQTDLQSQPYLVTSIVSQLSSDENKGSKDKPCNRSIQSSEIHTIHKKWAGILRKNFPKGEAEERELILKLSNRGNSDVVAWRIVAKIHIEPGDYLREEGNISDDTCSWIIQSENEEDYIEKNSNILVSISYFGNFPLATLTWEISYTDMREITYTKHAGKSKEHFENLLVTKKRPS